MNGLPAPIAEAAELMAARLGERIDRMSATDAKSFVEAGLSSIDVILAGLPAGSIEDPEAIRLSMREFVLSTAARRQEATRSET